MDAPRPSAGALARVAAVGVAAALFACVDLSTNPSEIVAIEFRPLPWPAVVQGDVLRDSLGNAAPLQARLFDAGGKAVTDQHIDFITHDTLVTIDANGQVVARAGVEGTAHLVASGAELQSTVRLLEVVTRPDSLIRDGTTAPLQFVIPDVVASNTSADVKLRIVHRDSATNTLKGVKGWVVRWTLEYKGAAVSPTDTTLVYLVNELGRASYVDTTDASGGVSRRVRFKPRPPVPALDSAVITAVATYKGANISRSPLRAVLSLSPKQ